MSPEEQNKESQTIAPPKTSNRKGLNVILLILMLAAVVATGWYIMDTKETTPATQANNQTSFLTNDNNALCLIETKKLICENLATQEVKEIDLPKKYHNAQEIIPSPDGTKLLVIVSGGKAVVTDTNFDEIRKIESTGGYDDNTYSARSWAGNSEQVFISEVRREQSDSDELPAPFVVEMLTIESGDLERVYKTGENVDVENIDVLGSNDTYLFVSYSTPKNWVADDVSPPQETISAVRLDNGAVQTVSTTQINGTFVNYNPATDNFLFESDVNAADSQDIEAPAKYPILAARLEDGETGLGLRKVMEFSNENLDTTGQRLAITSKGTVVQDGEKSPEPIMLITDNGTITELKLVRNSSYDVPLSLKAMPNIQAN